MEGDDTLLGAYQSTLESLEDTKSFIERNLPLNRIAKLSSAIDQLTSWLLHDHTFLEFVTNPEYGDILAEILKNPSGKETMRKLVAALNLATKFVTRTKVDSETDETTLMNLTFRYRQHGTHKLKGDVDAAIHTVNNLQTAIIAASTNFRSMFTSAAAITSKLESSRVKAYENARDDLVMAFRTNPFHITSPASKTSSKSFKILNHHLSGAFSSSEMIRHPCFKDIANVAVAWVNERIDVYQKIIDEETRREDPQVKPRRASHEVFRELLESLMGAVQSAQATALDTSHDKAWAGSIEKLSGCLSEVVESITEIRIMDQRSPRFALCGRVKAGKSTTVNVLVGNSLLPTSGELVFIVTVRLELMYGPLDDGCTAWPTVIRNKEISLPELRVNSDYFTPFLTKLREWNVPNLRDDANLTQIQEDMKEKYQTLHEDLVARMDQFMDPHFRVRELSRTSDEVKETVRWFTLCQSHLFIAPTEPDNLRSFPNIW
jgi:hypothetical protein